MKNLAIGVFCAIICFFVMDSCQKEVQSVNGAETAFVESVKPDSTGIKSDAVILAEEAGANSALEVLSAVEALPEIQKELKASKASNYRLSLGQKRIKDELEVLKEQMRKSEYQNENIESHIVANNEQ